jgi:hypothetical protein
MLIVITKQVTTHSLKIDHDISFVSLNEIDARPTCIESTTPHNKTEL